MKSILESPKLGAFIISLMVVITFMGVLAFAAFHGLQDNQTVQLLTGALVSNFSGVVAYWIGSSASSKDKDTVIAQQATTNAAVAVTNGGTKP